MLIVLLPMYNEEDSLDELLPKIRDVARENDLQLRVLACDDGSYDRTPELVAEYAKEYPLEVLTHKINRGLGETSRDLFERAAEISEPDDIIVRMDCDNTHEPHFIPAMIAKLDEGYDVVIASRFQPGGGQQGVDAYRALISRAANLFMKCFFPVRRVQEYSCGFRAYRARLIKKAIAFYGNSFIQLKGLGFTCTLEKLIKLNLLQARFAEVPFVLRYDQKQSASKMVSSITTLGYLTMVICHYWPFGGWRRNFGRRLKDERGERQS